MSTELLENDAEGVYLTRFYGGAAKGVCYQIATTKDPDLSGTARYVQLTDKQMAELCSAYILSKLDRALVPPKAEAGR